MTLPHLDLVCRLRDRERFRKVHGLSGWVLHEEALREEAALRIESLERDQAELLDALRKLLPEAGKNFSDSDTWRRHSFAVAVISKMEKTQ
jgi:hypothetical protein